MLLSVFLSKNKVARTADYLYSKVLTISNLIPGTDIPKYGITGTDIPKYGIRRSSAYALISR